MKRPPHWPLATEARLRWGTRRVLDDRFGERLRVHDAQRPPAADRSATRAWVTRGLELHGEVRVFADRMLGEVRRLRVERGRLDVEMIEEVLAAAADWPAEWDEPR